MQEDLYPSRVSRLPHIITRKDPVVYSDWKSDGPLNLQQYDHYLEKGYLVLPKLFDESEVALLCLEANAFNRENASISDETVFKELNSGQVRSVFKVHEQSKLFGRLARDIRLKSVAEFLLGDEVYIHQSRLNFKPGFGGKDFYWHSDFETWHVEDGLPRMRALSMSVLLTENLPTNGPTMFMPGSHKTFVSCVGETPDDHFKQSLRKQEYGVPDQHTLEGLAETGIDMPIGPAGSVVIFDCNVMHGSNSNITPNPRLNAFIVYNAVSNRPEAPYGQKKPRPHFVAERNNFDPLESIEGPITRGAA